MAEFFHKLRIAARGGTAQLVIDVTDDQFAKSCRNKQVQQCHRIRAARDANEILSSRRELRGQFMDCGNGHDGMITKGTCLAIGNEIWREIRIAIFPHALILRGHES